MSDEVGRSKFGTLGAAATIWVKLGAPKGLHSDGGIPALTDEKLASVLHSIGSVPNWPVLFAINASGVSVIPHAKK